MMAISLADALEQELTTRHGPILGGDALRQALGYPSMEAFRQALSRRQLPVPVFALPHRRGKFALTKDVAAWLGSLREPTCEARRPIAKKLHGGVP